MSDPKLLTAAMASVAAARHALEAAELLLADALGAVPSEEPEELEETVKPTECTADAHIGPVHEFQGMGGSAARWTCEHCGASGGGGPDSG